MSGKKPVVLVVDNEPWVLLDIEDSLIEAGYDVVSAMNTDGAMALLVSRRDISVVLTDVVIPGTLDGLGLINVIRHRWPPVKVMIMTGDIENSALPKDVPTFGKPFMMSDIMTATQILLAK